MSPCCGLEFFEIKMALFLSLWKKKPKDRITIITLQFAVVYMLQKNKDNTLVLLELHYVQLHAICTIYFSIWEYIHSIYSILRNQY